MDDMKMTIARINELARKMKSPSGLTEEEKQEQGRLRKRYLEAVKTSLRRQLDTIEFVEDQEAEKKGK